MAEAGQPAYQPSHPSPAASSPSPPPPPPPARPPPPPPPLVGVWGGRRQSVVPRGTILAGGFWCKFVLLWLILVRVSCLGFGCYEGFRLDPAMWFLGYWGLIVFREIWPRPGINLVDAFSFFFLFFKEKRGQNFDAKKVYFSCQIVDLYGLST